MKIEEALLQEYIEKIGDEWVVLSHDRKKRLGSYKTKEDAIKRLRQIEYFKNKG